MHGSLKYWDAKCYSINSECEVQDIPKMPSIECSLSSASRMLPEEASHPVYCTALDGLFVLSISCKPGCRSKPGTDATGLHLSCKKGTALH